MLHVWAEGTKGGTIGNVVPFFRSFRSPFPFASLSFSLRRFTWESGNVLVYGESGRQCLGRPPSGAKLSTVQETIGRFARVSLDVSRVTFERKPRRISVRKRGAPMTKWIPRGKGRVDEKSRTADIFRLPRVSESIRRRESSAALIRFPTRREERVASPKWVSPRISRRQRNILPVWYARGSPGEQRRRNVNSVMRQLEPEPVPVGASIVRLSTRNRNKISTIVARLSGWFLGKWCLYSDIISRDVRIEQVGVVKLFFCTIRRLML